MSNAEKMVSVPRALLMEAEASLRASGMAVTLAADIRKVLDQQSEQHQSEPVAWLVHGPTGCMGAYMKDPTHWAHGYRLEPLYTHADPGEVSLQQIMHAYEYAESHPHKYLRGTTNWCAAVAWHLNKNRGVQSGE